jgi:histidinol phosphatase-like enzyme (inositol monophosphatase family)
MGMSLPDRALETFETLAVELAGAAGAAILPLFRADHGLEDKGPSKNGAFDPVTRADKAAEAAIRTLVAARHPDHGFIGEEYGEDRADAEFVWVLDPIDGTRAFIAGLPLWTTLIALRWRGAPVVGAIGQSYLEEVFVGSRLGSRLIRPAETRTLRTRRGQALSTALIASTDPGLFKGREAEAWRLISGAARVTRYGCDAYAYAMVADGRLDLVAETGLKSWDVEAAVPLIEGAGGCITDWSGRPIGQHGGRLLITGDERLRDETLAILAPCV